MVQQYNETRHNPSSFASPSGESFKRTMYQNSLGLTRLPFMSPPSSIGSFPYPRTGIECSLNCATNSSSSLITDGQLNFRYSNSSVCITAETKWYQLNLCNFASKMCQATWLSYEFVSIYLSDFHVMRQTSGKLISSWNSDVVPLRPKLLQRYLRQYLQQV